MAGLTSASPSARGQQFAEGHRLLPLNRSAQSVHLGDFDGDGTNDAYLRPGRLLLNDGRGLMRDASDGLPEMIVAGASAAGDVDGDGDLDLYVASFAWGPDALYLNDGGGRFVDGSSGLPQEMSEGRAVAMGDVDGDGSLDVVVGNFNGAGSNGPANFLYLGDGTGTFRNASSSLPDNSEKTASIALADLDADGDLDIYVGDSLSPIDRLFLNDGSGSFVDRSEWLPAHPERSDAVGISDMDGDGTADIYVAGMDGDRLFLNDGPGAFVDASNLLPGSAASIALVLGDVDTDGDVDVLRVNPVTELLLNNGTGRLELSSTFQGGEPGVGQPTSVGLVDLDADGDLDVFLGRRAGFGDSETQIHLNDGDGGFVNATNPSFPHQISEVYQTQLGDLDGDGDLDTLVVMESGVWMSRNSGTGVFGAFEPLGEAGGGVLVAELGDVDGDGRLDIVLAGTGDKMLFMGVGRGAFVDASDRLPQVPGVTVSLELGDLNGDGYLDCYFGNSERDQLILSDGEGGYIEATGLIPSLPQYVQTVAVEFADIDLDQALDIVAVSYVPSQSARLLLNTGGMFVDRTDALPGQVSSVWDVEIVDVDGSGGPDIILGRGVPTAGQTLLWLNDGELVFTDGTAALPAVADLTRDITTADMDGDGDRDILVGNNASASSPQNQLILNDGAGAFSSGSHLLPAEPHRTEDLLAGDIDADGDMDLIYSYNGSTHRVLYNHQHQIAWDALPRAGKELRIKIFGQPGESWSLYAAPSVAPEPHGKPEMGEPVRVASGFFLAHGEAFTEYTVPDALLVEGSTIAWRALFKGGDAIFPSNYEFTTITGY